VQRALIVEQLPIRRCSFTLFSRMIETTCTCDGARGRDLVVQQLGALADRRERRLQLVRDVAQKPVLLRLELLEPPRSQSRPAAEVAQVLGSAHGDRLGEIGAAELRTRYIADDPVDGDDRQLGGADFSKPIRRARTEDLRYLGRRLDWLRRRLEEFETQKNRFLRHVSHELKTPLTAIREGAELLNDKVAGPSRRRRCSGLDHAREQREAAAPDRELLDYQRALHAAASLEVRLVELNELCAMPCSRTSSRRRRKGLAPAIDAQTRDARSRFRRNCAR